MTQIEESDISLKILNEKNIPITEEYVNSIFKKVGFDHKVSDISNYQLAMIHESYLVDRLTDPKTISSLKDIKPNDPNAASKAMPLQKHPYERLEFLGDAAIHYHLTRYLYERFPNMREGFMTPTRSKIEKGDTLCTYTQMLGLQKYAVIGYSLENENARLTDVKLLEDLFEAFVGAIDYEAGIAKSGEFVIKFIEKYEDIAEIVRTHTNYKEQLMQHYHKIEKNCRHDLKYVDEEFEGSHGKKRYHSRVYDCMTGEFLGEGQANSKKPAQQRAAKNALLRVGLIGEDDSADDDVIKVDFDIDEEQNADYMK